MSSNPSNKHFFQLNDYTAAGNVGAATMSTTGDTDFGGRGDFAKDLRIRGDGSNANAGVVRFHANSSNQLFIDPANDGNNIFVFNSSHQKQFCKVHSFFHGGGVLILTLSIPLSI